MFLRDKATKVALQMEELQRARMPKDPALTGDEGQDLKSKIRSGQFKIV
jgi:hypothetical protein|tara:strand:- start:462 stop:608 length:147 start_codon:yes stop_codon:yes gene_type:complete